MNSKISVIVPIYNVEDYLHKCIHSVINQTYENLEIILIDDGSTDNSSKICDEYMKIDKRIKVIHKENGGLSDARNVGLSVATGDYIGFVDSDDYIDLNMIEKMIIVANKFDLDIVECKVNIFYEDESKKNCENIEYESFKIYNAEQGLKELILERDIHQTVWNKIYRNACVKGILFEQNKINEDEFWTYRVVGNALKIASIKNVSYYYRQRKNSIMNSKYSIKRLDGLEGRYNRLKYIKNNYSDLLEIDKLSFFYLCLYNYQCLLKCRDNNEIIIGDRIIKNYINNINFDTLEISKLSLKNRLWIFMSNVSLKFTCIVRNKFNIGV